MITAVRQSVPVNHNALLPVIELNSGIKIPNC